MKAPVLESVFNKVAGLETPTQVLCCEYCEIFKNTFFEIQLLMAASSRRILEKKCI